MLTHLDLFSGIGGFALAARWTGFQTIAFSEVDPYCNAVLRKHWPDVPNLGDINGWRDWPDLGTVSLITGGFPCQPHSLAGKRRGSEDHRYLWPAMRDVIGRYRPAWVLGENVAGILGVELDRVFSDLEGLGYRTQPFAIPACAVDARHRRNRVWIVAHAKGERLEGGINIQDQQAATIGLLPAGSSKCGRQWTVANTTIKRRVQGDQDTGRNSEGAIATEEWPRPANECRWPTEPDVGRMAHGIPKRVDRLRGLGNAIVPACAYQILKPIYEILKSTHQSQAD